MTRSGEIRRGRVGSLLTDPAISAHIFAAPPHALWLWAGFAAFSAPPRRAITPDGSRKIQCPMPRSAIFSTSSTPPATSSGWREPVSTVLEIDGDSDPPLLAEQGPAVLFEKPVAASGETSPMPGPRQPLRHGRAGRAGRHHQFRGRRRGRADAGKAAARSRRGAGVPAPAGTAGRLPRGRFHAAAAPHRHGDEAENGLFRALSGSRAQGQRHRPHFVARPDLLAGRARSAHHLAARRDQGSEGCQGRRFQSRHLPDAGAGQGQDDHAMARASRRRAASRTLEERKARAAARRLRHRRRPGHHPRRRHARAGHAQRISVRGLLRGQKVEPSTARPCR